MSEDASAEAALRIPRPRRAPAHRPTVLANFAMTWDGRISTRAHTPANFSSPLDKRRLLAVRAVADAVVAGHGTVRADNMSMGLSDESLRAARVQRGQAAYPLRVIVSQRGDLDPALKIFRHDFSRIVIFSTAQMPTATRAALDGKATLHLSETDSVDLAAMLQTLRKDYAVRSLVCEGGAMLFRSLLEIGAVDELFLTLCPRVFGGRGAPSITGPAGAFLPHRVTAKLMRMISIGDECFTHYRLPSADR